MPNIPVLEQQSVRPELGPVPNVEVNVAHRTAAAGIAEAATQGATTLGQMYEKHQAEADASAVTNAETKLKQAIDTSIYDPQTGLRSTQGAATLDAAPKSYADIQKAQEQISAGLNPRQQRLFNLRAGGMVEDAHKTGEEYVSQQIRVVKQANLQAGQQVSLGIIARDPTDDDTIARQTASMEGPLRAMAPTKEAGDAAVREWRGKVAQTVINARLTSGDTEGAVSFFSNPDVQEALGENVGRFQHTISQLSAQKQGVQQATSIIQGAKQDVTGFVDESKVQAELEKIPAGPTRNVVEEETRRQLTLAKQVETQTKANWFERALSSYYTSGKNPLAPSRDMMDNGLSVAGMLELHDPEGWTKFQRIVHEDQEHARSPASSNRPTPEQASAWFDLRSDMSEHPEQYRNMDPKEFARAYQAELGTTYFNMAGAKFAAIKGAQPKDVKLTGEASQIVREVVADAFKQPKDQWTKWAPQVKSYGLNVEDGVQQDAAKWSRDNGGKMPSREQYEEWARARVKSTEVDSGHWYVPNSTVPLVRYQSDPNLKGRKVVGQPSPQNSTSPEGVPASAQSPSPATPAPVVRTGKSGQKFVKNPKTGKWQTAD